MAFSSLTESSSCIRVAVPAVRVMAVSVSCVISPTFSSSVMRSNRASTRGSKDGTGCADAVGATLRDIAVSTTRVNRGRNLQCVLIDLADGVFMKRRIGWLVVMSSLLALAAPAARAQAPQKTLVAVFAHPDDERMAGPILARYAREGHRVHLVVATDGRKGVTKHAGIPAGDSMVAIRKVETECAARELGIEPPVFLGLEDGGLVSFAALGKLRSELRRVFETLRPDAIITFGPEGGTGHPDHRLVGVAVTEVVQRGGPGIPDALFYPALPAERMIDAPKASPEMNIVAMRHLNVRVAFQPRDFEAAHREYACHASQYTRDQVDTNMRYMRHAFGGHVYFRGWNDSEARSELF